MNVCGVPSDVSWRVTTSVLRCFACAGASADLPHLEGKEWTMSPLQWVAKKLAWTRFSLSVLRNVKVAVELSVGPSAEDRRAVNILLQQAPALVSRTSMDWSVLCLFACVIFAVYLHCVSSLLIVLFT